MSFSNIEQRSIRRDKLRSKARRKENTIRRLYKFVRFLLLVCACYGIYRLATCHYWYLSNNVYNSKDIKRVEILGNSIVSDSRIINEMKKIQLENKPIYKINPAQLSNQIQKLSPIKRAFIRRYWFPARLVVMVEEINPVISVSPDYDAPDVVAFALNGETVSREYLPLPEKYKTIKVLSYGNNGDDYEKWDKEKIAYLNKLAKFLEEYSGEKLEYIDLRTQHNAFAKLSTVTIKLGELDTSLFERIKPIKDILSSPDIIKLKQHTKYIDLSWQKVKYINLDE